MKCIAIIWVFYFLLCFKTQAQQKHSFITKQFTVENGLPSNGIKGIEWDEKTGFLWMATEAGIVRYDGLNFRAFTQQNTSFIGSERMSFITRSNAGNIYIADLEKNLVKVNGNRLESWAKASPDQNISYTISISERFYNYTSKNQKKQLQFNPQNTSITSISDTAGFILTGKRLYYFSLSMYTPLLWRDDVQNIFKVGSTFFIRNEAGNIFLINANTGKVRPVTITDRSDENASKILNKANIQWKNGMENPLVFSANKVWFLKWDGSNLFFDVLMNDFSNDAFIQSAQYSATYNILFVGSDSKGLRVYYPTRIVSKKEVQKNTTKNSYYSQIDLLNGNVLTNEGNIIGNSAIPTPIKINGKFTFATHVMGDTLIWYTQAEKDKNNYHLFSYNINSKSTVSYPKIVGADAFFNIGQQLYIIGSKGIFRLKGDSTETLYHFAETDNLFFSATEVSPGVIAIAGCKGLLTFNLKTNTLKIAFTEKNNCVRSLWKYKDYLFFGTYGSGYFIMKDGVIKRMPLDKNKYLLYTHCFVPDENGFVFMSTNRGLLKANLDQVLHAYFDPGINVYYYYLGKNDGMETTELNGGCTPCAITLKNKIISFPTMDGLVWVDPAATAINLPKGEIYIDDIISDDKIIQPTNQLPIHLLTNNSNFKISFAIASWMNRENIYMDYEINNSGWIPIDVDRGMEINLNNLAAGEYKIKIRHLDGFELNSFTYREISFIVPQKWYLRWWAILLQIAVLATIVISIIRVRTAQYRIREARLQKQVAEKTRELLTQNEVLEKNNTIKTRLISIISHDIITPLKFVTAAGANLLHRRKQMPEDLQNETIAEITNTASELHLLSTNILNWIKYQNENRRMAKETFNVYELVNQVLGILKTLAKQKNLEVINDVSQELMLTQYYEPLKILVYNLLTNAIQFSSDGVIQISSENKEGQVIISVNDNGIGMSEEQIDNILQDRFVILSANVDSKKGHGLGYLIIKDLIKMMNASIRIESVMNKGTNVNILFSETDATI